MRGVPTIHAQTSAAGPQPRESRAAVDDAHDTQPAQVMCLKVPSLEVHEVRPAPALRRRPRFLLSEAAEPRSNPRHVARHIARVTGPIVVIGHSPLSVVHRYSQPDVPTSINTRVNQHTHQSIGTAFPARSLPGGSPQTTVAFGWCQQAAAWRWRLDLEKESLTGLTSRPDYPLLDASCLIDGAIEKRVRGFPFDFFRALRTRGLGSDGAAGRYFAVEDVGCLLLGTVPQSTERIFAWWTQASTTTS